MQFIILALCGFLESNNVDKNHGTRPRRRRRIYVYDRSVRQNSVGAFEWHSFVVPLLILCPFNLVGSIRRRRQTRMHYKLIEFILACVRCLTASHTPPHLMRTNMA